MKTVIDDYGDAPWLRDDLVTRMLLYAAIFIISSMAGEFSSGAPWPPFWPAQSTVLSDVLNAMDCPPALA